jgi:hypothetical protein
MLEEHVHVLSEMFIFLHQLKLLKSEISIFLGQLKLLRAMMKQIC